MRFTEKKIITAGDMSQATVASFGMHVDQGVNWTIQAIWTGVPVGNFTIQVSNDIVAVNPVSTGDPAINVVNWTTYTGSSTAAGGAPGDFAWIAQNAGYQWVRLLYTRTSGTGTVNATFNGKGV